MAVGLGRLAKMLLGTDERLSAVLRFLHMRRRTRGKGRSNFADLVLTCDGPQNVKDDLQRLRVLRMKRSSLETLTLGRGRMILPPRAQIDTCSMGEARIPWPFSLARSAPGRAP